MEKRLQKPVSGLTHLVGVLLAAVRLVVLLATAAGAGRTDHFVTFGIFRCSMIALYGRAHFTSFFRSLRRVWRGCAGWIT